MLVPPLVRLAVLGCTPSLHEIEWVKLPMSGKETSSASLYRKRPHTNKISDGWPTSALSFSEGHNSVSVDKPDLAQIALNVYEILLREIAPLHREYRFE